MNTKDVISELSTEEREAERQKRKRRALRKKIVTIVDRIFGFILATCIVFGLAGLALEYVLIKGPSPALKETFVMTMLETRRFGFIPHIFLTDEEMNEMKDLRKQDTNAKMDESLINLSGGDSGGQEADPGTDQQESPYPADEDGDGIIFENIKGNGFVGYMLTILDPTRVFIGMPDGYGGAGLRLDELVNKYGALGGINAGGFYDDGGGGLGGDPDGLTIIDGVVYNEGHGTDCIVGLNEEGLMYVGYYTLDEALGLGLKNCVSFSPLLIQNGVGLDVSSSGVNPRTAIAQRSDGAIMMLVIDGRQAHSMGAKYQDVVDILLDYGAVNAINLDGGSSTVMWYEGDYVNSCSSENGICRDLPNAFLFK